MMTPPRVRFPASSGLIALLLVGSKADAGAMYAATALSEPRSFNDVPRTSGINNRGQVAGSYEFAYARVPWDPTPEKAEAGFIYSGGDGGRVNNLGTTAANAAPGAENATFPITRINGINDSGQVVGQSVDLEGNIRGFVHGEGQYSAAPGNPVAINNSGQVAGLAHFANGQFTDQPVSYSNDPTVGGTLRSYISTDGGLKDLGTVPGSTATTVSAINDSGQAAGIATFAVPGSNWPTTHAFFFDGHAIKDIGTLGGAAPYGTYVGGMNNQGDVIGSSAVASDSPLQHAFVSHQGGPMVDLGTLADGRESNANGINNRGQIVGNSMYLSGHGATYGYAPFLYQNGKMTDLNTLVDPLMGVTLQSALQINDAGQITAQGFYNYQPGLWRLFLLTPEDQPQPAAPDPLIEPVPEPSQMAIYAAILAAVAWRRGRSAR